VARPLLHHGSDRTMPSLAGTDGTIRTFETGKIPVHPR
jgi:hypothetical protein